MLFLKNELIFIYIVHCTTSIKNYSIQFNQKPTVHHHHHANHILQLQEDAMFETPDLIKKYGYPVEIHHVTTQDNYILTMHRIPHKRSVAEQSSKGVVLLQHGILSNSAEVLIAGPGRSLAYLLADLNYDVWLGNTRGNRYSTKHKHLNVNSKQFWDFSWSEMGYYDLPAMIDYILQETKEEKLFYIGHSRGTLVFYVMCAERPEYNEKIRAMISLAPVAYMSHIPSTILRTLAAFTQQIHDISQLFHVHRILLNRAEVVKLGQLYCNDNTTTQAFCATLLFSVGGFDLNFNQTLLPVIFGHMPDSISIKELCHFGQIITSGKLRKIDYGIFGNMRKYNNSIHPPKYDMGRVSAPVALFYSENDWESSPIDVDRLYGELKNPIGKFVVPQIRTHYYFFLKNMTAILFHRIVHVLEKY